MQKKLKNNNYIFKVFIKTVKKQLYTRNKMFCNLKIGKYTRNLRYIIIIYNSKNF